MMSLRTRILTCQLIEMLEAYENQYGTATTETLEITNVEDERRVNMARRTRSDCTVGSFEKKHGLPPGTIRNKNGRDTRSDKKIGTIRKENGMK